MESEREDVATAIRSCLLTFKHGTKLAELNRDYKSLEGSNIPFRKFGFSSLETFIQNLPGLRTSRRGSDLWVESIPTRETQHISKLVAGQNRPKNRRGKTFHHFTRFNRGMSLIGVQPVTMGNRAPARVNYAGNYNTRDNGSTRPQGGSSELRPLMQTMVQSLITNTTGSTQAESPSKLMMQRSIQPRHDLDYAAPPKPTMGLHPTTNIQKTVVPSGNPQRPKSAEIARPQQTFQTASTASFTKASGTPVDYPIAPVPLLINKPLISSPTGIPWQPPPSRLRLADRLAIQQSANKNIQITFPNVKPTNGVDTQAPTPSIQDPREDLRRIARELGRGEPVFKTIPVHGKGSAKVYGKVEIGASKFSSYPEEAQTPDEAEILAAEQALKELKKEYHATQRFLQTTNKELMKKRLLEIVDQHNGVFMHKIPAFYQEQFNENLSSNWTEEISHWQEVSLEKGVNDSMILCRAAPLANDNAPGLPITEKAFLKPICYVEPGRIELPDGCLWVVHVTLVTSTTEVWVRLVGEEYNEKFEEMSSEMMRYYSTITTSCENIESGNYYAIMDNGMWYRVRVLDCDPNCEEAELFFIDVGDVDTVNVSRLYTLDRKFSSLPSQATRVSLVGLEDFDDCDSVIPLIDKLLADNVFYVVEIKRETDDYGQLAHVILNDTAGPDDIDMNNFIRKQILETITPRLEDAGRVCPVHVSHVETNGDVYIQVKHDGLKALVKMLNKLIETGLSAEDLSRCAVERFESTAVYFVRCSESGDWYRAKLIASAPNGKDGTRGLKMFLIDFGRTIVVEPSNVMKLEKLSELLAKYPAQAIKVRLDKLESNMFSVDMIERMKELAPPSQLLILKIVKPFDDTDSLPVVELFKKMPPDNILGSINNTLVLESECSKCVDEDGNNNVKPRKRVERVNSRSNVDVDETARALSAPKIGKLGEFFDVHVTMAANPANFTVQPLESKEELSKMMTKIQEAFENPNKDSHPTLESIGVGRLYAAQHTDGSWYRGCVLHVINEHMLSVYFVDYGDVAVLGLENLLPLPRQFLDLPYQAIKARLVGIKPKRMDWSPEDCVRFQNLTVERDFVSVIAEVDADRHLPRDTVLGLNLIDVSTSEDTYIAQVLVNEGRAVYVV